MRDDFSRALAFVLRWEGSTFTDDPADPGGATLQGVTQRTYDAWRRRSGWTLQSVTLMTSAERDFIYDENYWQPAGCDYQPWPLCLVNFDTAVNMGVKTACTFNAATRGNVTEYLAARRLHYANLVERNQKLGKFLRGWLNRVDALQAEAAVA